VAAPKRPGATGRALLTGPIVWWRVLAGGAIVLAGLFWPRFILDFVVNASYGKLTLTSQLQAQLITWEIIGVVTLLGAGVAGATTRNGLKQGLIVGLVVSIVVAGVFLGNRAASLEQTLLMVFIVLALTIAGAWFGGQLFPPVYQLRRRRPA
jgi:hypothetical protein